MPALLLGWRAVHSRFWLGGDWSHIIEIFLTSRYYPLVFCDTHFLPLFCNKTRLTSSESQPKKFVVVVVVVFVVVIIVGHKNLYLKFGQNWVVVVLIVVLVLLLLLIQKLSFKTWSDSGQ